MDLAPIVLFVYARPWHTLQTLQALEKNVQAKDSTLYIYADAPKENAEIETLKKIEEVRQLIRKDWQFKEVCVVERDRNWGLADNIVDGVTKIVNEYGKIIVLEDDIVTSVGFLRYMNDALELYKNEEKVMHISGYMFPVKGKLPSTFFYNTTSCWGWATWKRAWQYYESSAHNMMIQIKQENKINKFNIQGSYNFYHDLILNAEGKMKTWAVKWYASMFIREGYALHPFPSLTNNIGHDGSGENCHELSKFSWEKLATTVEVTKIPLETSQEAINLMIRYHQPKKGILQKIKQSIKNNIPNFIIQKLKNNAKTYS